MILVDIRNLLCCQLVLIPALDTSENYLVGIAEPNGFIVVLKELALHAQDLDVVQLGQEVGNLVALFLAVLELIGLDQLHIISQSAIVVLNFLARVAHVHRSVKLDNEGLTDALLRLDACLHALEKLRGLQTFAGVVKGFCEGVLREQFNFYVCCLVPFTSVVSAHDHR